METKELYENNGKEAEKWLKQNDITISTTVIYARVARRLAQI
jgi:hypothetical protein